MLGIQLTAKAKTAVQLSVNIKYSVQINAIRDNNIPAIKNIVIKNFFIPLQFFHQEI